MEKVTTYNQLFDLLESFAKNHPEIQSYSLGTELQLDIKKNEDFTKLFVLVGPAEYLRSTTAGIQIIIVDRVATLDNTYYQNEVLSDTYQICGDFIAWAKFKMILPDDISISFEPVFYEHDNVLTGWKFNLAIPVDFRFDSCFLNPITDVFDFTYDNSFN
jgi:hypothetical protein